MTAYRLYGYPQSGSAVVELALVAGGIAHELVELDPEAGDLSSAAFLKINPRGQVPVLCLPDGSAVTELPAILNHLADAHPGCGLAPPPGTAARAQHDRWLAFVHANVYEGVLRFFYTERYTTDPAGVPGVREAAEAYVLRHLEQLNAVVGEGPFLFGPAPMGVDYLITVILSWLDQDKVARAAPCLLALAEAVKADPRLVAVAARKL
ncbi:Gst Glutathione S-transferase [Paracoccaceae bacterium]